MHLFVGGDQETPNAEHLGSGPLHLLQGLHSVLPGPVNICQGRQQAPIWSKDWLDA